MISKLITIFCCVRIQPMAATGGRRLHAYACGPLTPPASACQTQGKSTIANCCQLPRVLKPCYYHSTSFKAPLSFGSLFFLNQAEVKQRLHRFRCSGMAGGRKGLGVLIKLVSTAGTGYFYVKKKNPRTLPNKLQFVKYDPRVRKHVLFTEQKMR